MSAIRKLAALTACLICASGATAAARPHHHWHYHGVIDNGGRLGTVIDNGGRG